MTPPAVPEASAAPAPVARHDYERRESDQWIREALQDRKNEIETVGKDLTTFRTEFSTLHRELNAFMLTMNAALPNGSVTQHQEDHKELHAEREARKTAEEEAQKIKRDLRHKFIMAAAQGIAIAIFGLLVLGMQAQFSIWVNRALPEAQKTTEVKK